MAARSRSMMAGVARRRYWREAEARRVIEAWRRSGQSCAAFAAQHGLHPRRLGRWIVRLDGASSRPRFHPVQVVSRRAALAPAGWPRLELVHSTGWTLRVPPGWDAAALRAVVAALTGVGPC